MVTETKENNNEGTENPKGHTATLMLVGGFVLLFLFAFVCYYFNIQLTDLT